MLTIEKVESVATDISECYDNNDIRNGYKIGYVGGFIDASKAEMPHPTDVKTENGDTLSSPWGFLSASFVGYRNGYETGYKDGYKYYLKYVQGYFEGKEIKQQNSDVIRID